jgi:hypothetical protein
MRAAILLPVLLVASACATATPVPIRAGDVCYHCRRPIARAELAAEIIVEQHAFKLSSVACLVDYLREHQNDPIRAVFVTDYDSGRLFPAYKGYFVKFEVDPRLKTTDYAAFRTSQTAQAFAAPRKTTVSNWTQVQADQTPGQMAH